MSNVLMVIVWFILLILVFPIAFFCAFVWVLLSCFGACSQACQDILNVLWKGTHSSKISIHFFLSKQHYNLIIFQGASLVQYCARKMVSA